MPSSRVTALDVLLGGTYDDGPELWLEYAPVRTEPTTQARLYYLYDDGTQMYVTDTLAFPVDSLDAFDPFAERRAGHIRLTHSDERHLRKSLKGTPLPLPPLGVEEMR